MERPTMATVSALIGQPTRADMLLLLLDGRSRTASELAEATGISRPTASFHLGQLVEGRLIKIDRQGRHRYFRLANQEVAGLLESLLAVADTPRGDDRQFGPRPTGMRRARMCYDHIAGELGIGIVDHLTATGALIEDEGTFRLTPGGERQFEELGIDIMATRRRRRHFARTCVDWSERRPHLAGALGAAVAERLFEMSWIHREPEGRTLYITPEGQRGFATSFNLDVQTD